MEHRQRNGFHTHTVFVTAWKAIRPMVQDLYKFLITNYDKLTEITRTLSEDWGIRRTLKEGFR